MQESLLSLEMLGYLNKEFSSKIRKEIVQFFEMRLVHLYRVCSHLQGFDKMVHEADSGNFVVSVEPSSVSNTKKARLTCLYQFL